MPPLLEINLKAKKSSAPTLPPKGADSITYPGGVTPFIGMLLDGMRYILKDNRVATMLTTKILHDFPFMAGKIEGYGGEVLWTPQGLYAGKQGIVMWPNGMPNSKANVVSLIQPEVFLTVDEAWDWWQDNGGIRYSPKNNWPVWSPYPAKNIGWSLEQFTDHFNMYYMRRA